MKYNELEDLKVADLACGSGHILNECFDLLYDLYIAEGYGRGEAVENIFSHNLTGIDLDTRAKQLSQFALLLKACQKDAAFADAHCMPKVLDMPKPYDAESVSLGLDSACLKFMGGYETIAGEMLEQDMELLMDANDLGSIMKFNDDEDYLAMLRHYYEDWTEEGIDDCPNEIKALIPGVQVILALTEKYHALVMNPPYMGSKNMNGVLSKYVKDEYKDSKADLFSVFMQMGMERIVDGGKMAQINMQSWMFLSSFEKLRKQFLTHYNIDNMLHLGPRTFDELSGEVVQNTAFVLSKHEPAEQGGVYYRLVDGKNCADKEQLFLSHIHGNEDGNRIYYPNVEQKNFEKIPESRIGYWISKNVVNKWQISLFDDSQIIIRQGLASGDNERFIRFWHEISKNKFKVDASSCTDAIKSKKKWFPFHKGGEARSWYGNSGNVISFDEESYNTLLTLGNHLPSKNLYFKEGVLFSRISSKKLNAKYTPSGFVFDGSAPLGIAKDNLYEKLGFMCSKSITIFLQVLAPTLTFQVGDVRKSAYVPISNSKIKNTVLQNISISKSDWDAHETSWDFQRNELLSIDTSTYTENIDYEIEKHFDKTGEHICISPAAPKLGSLEWRMEQYKTKWERKFMQLHKNEEELNRQFIDIYGLQDELTPDVPLNEITILQQGEIKITDQYSLSDNDGSILTDSDGAILTVTGNSYLDWQDDVIMKQLISYAVGCMLGRYRLDKPGLHIAHPNPTDEEIAPYEYNGEQWEIDDDGIMPLMPNDCGFSDNASARFADFIRVALGNEDHVANLNYVEQCLGKTVEQYFVKDFWKDHKKMYQKRPIYWLFSSKKGAFQVIAYMHRMNAYTAERVRSKYLLPYIEHLEAEIDKLDARRAELSTKESKQLQTLQKQLDECREYHERLQVVAEQAISFDLDDGVVVNYAKFGDVLKNL